MKRHFLTILCVLVVTSCTIKKYKNLNENRFPGYKSVHIQNLVEDSTLNIRAIDAAKITKDSIGVCAFLTSQGEFGTIYPNYLIKHVDSLKDRSFYVHRIKLSNDSTTLNFRAIAIRENLGYGITIGNPAKLYNLDADL